MVTERHDRGQLILITAIAVAFILLAIVIVFNGLLFTQTIASEDASKATTDVRVTDSELEHGIQGVILRSNLEGIDGEEPVESYVAEYRNATGAIKPAMVTVTEYDVTEYGRWESGEISADSKAEILNVTDTSDTRAVGQLVVDVSQGDDVNFVSVEGGNELEITIEDGNCEAERFDLMTGTAFDERGNVVEENDCAIGDEPDPRTEFDLITVDNDLNSEVQYKIVAEETGSLGPSPGVNPDDAEVPWAVELTYTYDSSDVTATQTITIENVYEDAAHVWPGGESP